MIINGGLALYVVAVLVTFAVVAFGFASSRPRLAQVSLTILGLALLPLFWVLYKTTSTVLANWCWPLL